MPAAESVEVDYYATQVTVDPAQPDQGPAASVPGPPDGADGLDTDEAEQACLAAVDTALAATGWPYIRNGRGVPARGAFVNVTVASAVIVVFNRVRPGQHDALTAARDLLVAAGWQVTPTKWGPARYRQAVFRVEAFPHDPEQAQAAADQLTAELRSYGISAVVRSASRPGGEPTVTLTASELRGLLARC